MRILRPCIAEFIGTFTLIFVGIGAINNLGANQPLGVALAHGLAIAVMVSATMHISGGMLNPAVTLGVLIAGRMSVREALLAMLSQLSGAVVAALLCGILFTTKGVIDGTPQVASQIEATSAILIEAVLTFFLVFVVFGTGVDERGRRVGGLAIGFAVAMGILFADSLTGGAMNPARVFGPAVAANFWEAHYVYWVGPMLGGALAGLVYGKLLLPPVVPVLPVRTKAQEAEFAAV